VFVVCRKISNIFIDSYLYSIDRSTDISKADNTNPIITIKLNEKDELITDSNTGQQQQYFAETFFQMNTSTGEWKRIKKLRPLNQTS
jgi:hypothetical protein